jgi:hypothetical protein
MSVTSVGRSLAGALALGVLMSGYAKGTAPSTALLSVITSSSDTSSAETPAPRRRRPRPRPP